jgi:hypothetical protein
MPELYIGNATKHTHVFAYRALERLGVITQVIPTGGQIRVSPNGMTSDLNSLEIEYIVGQQRAYGLIPIEELDKTNPFYGLIYSIGKPLSEEKLRRAIDKRENELRIMGQKIRQEAALAVNSQIESRIGAPLRQLEMSFTEEEPRSGYADIIDHVSEGVRVTRTTEDGSPILERGRGRGRR